MLCFMLIRWGGYIVVLGIQTQKRKVSKPTITHQTGQKETTEV